MNEVVFLKFEFWLLAASSLLLPGWICWFLLSRRSISRRAVFLSGVVMLLLSALDLVLLPALYNEAKQSPGLLDDAVFASSYSIALYLLPLLSAGLGVNLISHVLRAHLSFAELRYDEEHKPRPPES